MRNETIILFLCLAVAALLGVVVYQQLAFRRGLQSKLQALGDELRGILDTDSDEQLMLFSDTPALIALTGQINRLLDDRQALRVRYCRTEQASRTMLSNISHDIKTTLTVILGYLEILQLRLPDEPALAKTECRARQVLALIEQFFTLAKLEAGDTDLPLSRLAVNEPCRQAVLDFYELLTEQGFTVEAAIPEAPLYVQSNAGAIGRILSNLIANAVRYGAGGRYLGITLRADEHTVAIDITDKGRGIEPEAADRVFDRLYTLSDSRSREVQGNGLGLTIAKSLAGRLGGTLTLKSVPHRQTVFTLTLKRLTY